MTVSIPLLRRDHVHFSLILDMLERQAAALESGARTALPLISLGLKYFRDYPRRVHHPKEDLIYNALRHHLTGSADVLFNALEEHDELHQELSAVSGAFHSLEKKAADAALGACERLRRFTARERRHMEMEEIHLYPAADRLLTPRDWQSIADACTDEKDPVFSDEVTASFDRLLASILMNDAATRITDV